MYETLDILWTKAEKLIKIFVFLQPAKPREATKSKQFFGGSLMGKLKK